MRILLTTLLACGSLLALGACGNGNNKTITEPAPAPSVSFADIRKDLASGEVSDEVAPAIDRAAKNVNPFKKFYTYTERELFNGLLIEASKDPEYLDRSLLATQAGLEEFLPEFDWPAYMASLNCAAAIDAATRTGLIPAHQAQAEAEDVIRNTVRAWEAPIQETKPITARLKRTADYRKRSYLNYQLIKAGMMTSDDPGAISAGYQDCALVSALDGVTIKPPEVLQ